MSRRGAGALFGSILLACVLIAPSGAAARRAGFYGVNLGAARLTDRDARQMARGGVRYARFQINWKVSQPVRGGSFDWGAADYVMSILASNRIQAMPTLIGTPAWLARSQFASPVKKGLGRRGWRRFVRAAVARYGPRGAFWSENPSLRRVPIHAWEAWNEPNFPFYWHTQRPVRDYVRLLAIAAPAIRREDPRAKIVLAGLGPGLARKTQIPCWEFLRRIYRARAGRYFDVVGDHPYAAGVSSMARQIRHVEKVIRYRHDRAPIWVNELGWSSGHYRGNRLQVGAARQAQLLRRSFKYIARHRRRLGVRRLLWFDWRDPRNSGIPACQSCQDFGLHRHNRKAKPAWRAFRAFAR